MGAHLSGPFVPDTYIYIHRDEKEKIDRYRRNAAEAALSVDPFACSGGTERAISSKRCLQNVELLGR